MSLTEETRRIDAAWLNATPLSQVLDALSAGGSDVRVVGGAVRDALLGRPIAEVDIATPARPEAVMQLAQAAGFAVHPTGLDHGTVTIVTDKIPFEVTTLRRDVETDGRHAVVAFTTSWAEDAARRDFTINALSCTRDGIVHDVTGGLDDLDARQVRFIGIAESRIAEDYLRILRFFRFTADIAKGPPDAQGLAACTKLRDGIGRLSAERVGAELLKLVATPRAGEVARIMQQSAILPLVIGHDGFADRLIRLQAIEAALRDTVDPLTRLAALAIDGPADVSALAQRLRLSNDPAAKLIAAATPQAALAGDASPAALRALLYRLGPETYARAVRYAWARTNAAPSDPNWRLCARLAESWSAPALPFGGADVLALGVPPGPKVGRILKDFEDWWIGSDFTRDPEVLRNTLATLAAQG